MVKNQATMYFKYNNHSTLAHLKAMNKKFAITVVQKRPKKMD